MELLTVGFTQDYPQGIETSCPWLGRCRPVAFKVSAVRMSDGPLLTVIICQKAKFQSPGTLISPLLISHQCLLYRCRASRWLADQLTPDVTVPEMRHLTASSVTKVTQCTPLDLIVCVLCKVCFLYKRITILL